MLLTAACLSCTCVCCTACHCHVFECEAGLASEAADFATGNHALAWCSCSPHLKGLLAYSQKNKLLPE